MADNDSAPGGLPLAGQAAIVTGSGRGIGAACAVHLARLGADVVVNYVSDEHSAAATSEQIQQAGARAVVVGADVSTPEGAASLVDAATSNFGRLDILVSNAGPLFRPIPLVDMTWEDFDGIVRRDLQAAFCSTKAVLPTMIEQHRGRIVYIGSSSAHHPTPGLAHHGTARAGLAAFAAYVAKEVGKEGITANVVAPGMVRTDRTAMIGAGLDHMGAMAPVGRVATPEDVARAVGFFAADADGFYTGARFPVDGGMTIG